MHRTLANSPDIDKQLKQQRESRQRGLSLVSRISRYLFPKPEILEFNDNQPLRNALQIVCPTWNLDDQEKNPLNLLLPAYGTLWPIVLYCFLELKYRGHANAGSWIKTIQKFARNSTPAQLDTLDPEHGISARMVIDEVFRLYPPVTIIPRPFVDTASRQKFHLLADIETCQRKSEV